jgi:hypothetical protein
MASVLLLDQLSRSILRMQATGSPRINCEARDPSPKFKGSDGDLPMLWIGTPNSRYGKVKGLEL